MGSVDSIEFSGAPVPAPAGLPAPGPDPAGSRPARLAAAGTVVLWASAFPAIAMAVPRLGPAGLSVARLGVASLTLAAAAPFLRVRWPRARDLPLIALCGLAGMT